MDGQAIFGAIEAGGTKFVCSVGSDNSIVATTTIETTDPEETVARACLFFDKMRVEMGCIRALGIGAFGPVQIDPSQSNYGCILETPKPGWAYFDIRKAFMDRLAVPVWVNTDVNCALLAEAKWGAGEGVSKLLYITVGTGIGGSLMHDGELINGWSHPEMGHMLIARRKDDVVGFSGVCPYHGDGCVEGLASGPALLARAKAPLHTLAADSPIWELEASYLATLCLNVMMVSMPQKIILGGGVMQQSHLFPKIRKNFWQQCNGYLNGGISESALENMIVPVALAGSAGALGALKIAAHGYLNSSTLR